MINGNPISVIVATFGDRSVWEPLAERAMHSVRFQTEMPREILRIHGDTLAEARNRGAEESEGDYLLFLDADDELDAAYVEAMTAAINRSDTTGKTWLYQPATLGVYEDGTEDAEAVLIPQKNSLYDGNWLVIGTVCERSVFLDVGGFDPEFDICEDWETFIRIRIAGAGFIQVPEAVYRVHVRPDSRNKDQQAQIDVFRKVQSMYRADRGLLKV